MPLAHANPSPFVSPTPVSHPPSGPVASAEILVTYVFSLCNMASLLWAFSHIPPVRAMQCCNPRVAPYPRVYRVSRNQVDLDDDLDLSTPPPEDRLQMMRRRSQSVKQFLDSDTAQTPIPRWAVADARFFANLGEETTRPNHKTWLLLQLSTCSTSPRITQRESGDLSILRCHNRSCFRNRVFVDALVEAGPEQVLGLTPLSVPYLMALQYWELWSPSSPPLCIRSPRRNTPITWYVHRPESRFVAVVHRRIVLCPLAPVPFDGMSNVAARLQSEKKRAATGTKCLSEVDQGLEGGCTSRQCSRMPWKGGTWR